MDCARVPLFQDQVHQDVLKVHVVEVLEVHL